MKYHSDRLLRVVDLIGTTFFGIEGAMAAIAHNLDFFGVMVLSFATALGGGVIRDLLIGVTPPAAIRKWYYPVAAFSGGTVAFILNHLVSQIPSRVVIGIDAAGLSLFAVVGAAKALDYNITPLLAALLGTITGVGGGVIRDIFLAQVPAILQVDIYAVAALAGATVMIIGIRLGISRPWMMGLGAVVCFLLRVVSVWQHWNLPRVTNP